MDSTSGVEIRGGGNGTLSLKCLLEDHTEVKRKKVGNINTRSGRATGKSMCGRARANRVLRSGEGLEGRCTGQWGLGSKWRDWRDDSEVRALTTLAEDASSVPSSHTGELTTAWSFSSRKEAHTQLSWKGVGF